MAITDGIGQPSIAPPRHKRPIKARLLVNGYDSDSSDCNDGNDGSGGTDGNAGNDSDSSESSDSGACNEDNAANSVCESGIDTSSQQHDNAEPTEHQSHEDDTTVNVERHYKDSVLPELEDSRGSEGIARQTGKKRMAPNDDHSDDGSNAGLDAAS